MALDPDAEYAKLDAIEKKELEDNAELAAFIQGSAETAITVEHGGKSIKIKPTVPKGIRSELVVLSQKYKGLDLDKMPEDQALEILVKAQTESEFKIYRLLSQVCMEAPYNTAAAWEYYDNLTGQAPLVLVKVQAAIEGFQEKIASFRKKPSGAGTR